MLASTECLWVVPSGQLHLVSCTFWTATFFEWNPSVVHDLARLFLVTFYMKCWRHCQWPNAGQPFWTPYLWIICLCLIRFVISYFGFWGRTFLFTVSRDFTKWLKRYCSIQCDTENSLQLWNTENIKVLTNSAWNSYIGTNTSCSLFLWESKFAVWTC